MKRITAVVLTLVLLTTCLAVSISASTGTNLSDGKSYTTNYVLLQ